ncbi:phage holin family protein [Ferdinandcohnia quinoae]|uniref:Phage holin family protein n=1 Tax=Fredinandcohnia quinoae TaxID=2918902 RepID=A0AAW5DYS9_9BACI|nr:phage holin family protein [Fredinandcohnia sp. SECRCQ15]MCH1625800.1 phage holin family protein [Fredinandcohnia sp. SECRCQ15]
MKWIASIIVNSIILIVVAGYVDTFHLEGIGAAVIASIILSVLNVIVKPILIIFTLPVTVLTLGLFLFVINAITLMLTQSLMGDSFVIEGFGTAILAAVIISILNLLIQKVIIEPLQEKKK